MVIDRDLAARRRQLMQKKLDQGRFARTALSDNKDELPFIDMQRDVVDRRLTLFVRFTYVVKIDNSKTSFNLLPSRYYKTKRRFL